VKKRRRGGKGWREGDEEEEAKGSMRPKCNLSVDKLEEETKRKQGGDEEETKRKQGDEEERRRKQGGDEETRRRQRR